MSEPSWSVAESEVFRQARELLDDNRDAVLATILDVEGRAYRRPGAKMVIPEGGRGFGHITAGCLEDEVERLAEEVLSEGDRRIVTYDLRPEAEEDVWGLGVGCNGILDILLEPLDESFEHVIDAREKGRDIAVVTVMPGEGEGRENRRAFYAPTADTWHREESIAPDVRDRVRPIAAHLASVGKADLLEFDDTRIFVDGITPPERLVVVGTGHDVQPIAELGNKADFHVTVVGFRGAAAKQDRFPHADEVASTSPARIRDTVDFDEDTYVVVATHNFIDDRLTVERLLTTPVPYIGLMGPRERFEEMLEEFAQPAGPDDVERVFTPVGLDLGGGSPHQIAISIISEVLAVANDRSSGHLKDRERPIHDRLGVSLDETRD